MVNEENNLREKRVFTNLTSKEYEEVVSYCDRAGLDRSNLIRNALLEKVRRGF
jgi:hypothetical protein